MPYLLCCLIIVSISWIYFQVFGSTGSPYVNLGGQDIILTYNYPDHDQYYDLLVYLSDFDYNALLAFNNNFGISFLYTCFFAIFNVNIYGLDEVRLYTFVINSVITCGQVLAVKKLIKHLNGSEIPSFLILCPTFYFYGAYINKDNLAALVVLLFCVTLASRKYIYFFPIFLLACAVRMQYAALFIIFLPIILSQISIYWKMFFMYLVGAVIGTYASIFGELINFDKDTGLNILVDQINNQYYIGSLVLDWVKIARYFVIPFSNADEIFELTEINLMKIFYLTCGIIFLKLALSNIDFVKNILLVKSENVFSHIFLFIWAYMNLLVASPVTDYRYFSVLLPLFITLNSILKERKGLL